MRETEMGREKHRQRQTYRQREHLIVMTRLWTRASVSQSFILVPATGQTRAKRQVNKTLVIRVYYVLRVCTGQSTRLSDYFN